MGKGARNAQRAVYAIAVALADGSMDSARYDGGDYRRQRAYYDHLVRRATRLAASTARTPDEINEALGDANPDGGGAEGGEA